MRRLSFGMWARIGFVSVIVSACSFFGHAFAATWLDVLPKTPSSPVVDVAGILSVEDKTTMAHKLDALRPQVQMAVVVVQSLDGNDIADVAQDVFTQWGIGEKGKDNGVLLMVSMNERKSRLQTGYGMEELIPDVMAARLLDQDLAPYFRNSQYADGLNAVIDKIATAVQSGEPLAIEDTSTDLTSNEGSDFGAAMWWIFLVFPFFSFIFNPIFWWLGKSKAWWHGGVITGGIATIVVLLMGVGLFGGLSLIFIAASLGWMLDWIAGRVYNSKRSKFGSDKPWWIFFPPFGGGHGGSGFGSSSSGGFGGFGGGSSGGGGASGSW